MSYQSHLPHRSRDAEDGSKSNPIPIPNLHLIGLNTDTSGFTSHYCSPSSVSESTFSSPTFSPNQPCFDTPLMGPQSPNLFAGCLNSLHSMDTFSIQSSQPVYVQPDLSYFGLFAPQTSDSPLDRVSYTVDDSRSPGGSRAAQASHSMPFSPISGEDPTPRGTTSGVGYFVPGNPSDYFNTTGVSTFGSNSSPQPILPSSASGLSPAQLVDCLRHSPYVTEHCLEPTDHRRRSIFLELLHETPNLPHHFKCIVPRSDGTPCAKTFNRADRGLTHIRTHFDHRPFSCNGRCSNKICSHKFHSNEGLAAHLNPKFEICKKCDSTFRRQNIRRHEERCSGPQ